MLQVEGRACAKAGGQPNRGGCGVGQEERRGTGGEAPEVVRARPSWACGLLGKGGMRHPGLEVGWVGAA